MITNSPEDGGQAVNPGMPEHGCPTVFDLDETLADSAAAWNEAFCRVAARHGYVWDARDWEAIQGSCIPLWSRYLADRCPGLAPWQATADCADWMVAAVTSGRIDPLPGAIHLVATAARVGPIGLVSAAPRRYVVAAAEAFGLMAYLSAVVAGEDVTRGKPAPDPYLLAAARLGVPPHQCLAVEDSGSGIRSAHAAGMTVLAIPNPKAVLDRDALALATYQAADAVAAVSELPVLAAPV
nr:HAD family phosphatase [Kibdelosporangium sp. MJ126-NF4]